MLNKKRNTEDDYNRDDEWKGNIFEDTSAPTKPNPQRPESSKKFFQEQKDARDIYRNEFSERREGEFKDYEYTGQSSNMNYHSNSHHSSHSTRRFQNPRHPNDPYFSDQRRPKNYNNTSSRFNSNFDPKGENFFTYKRNEFPSRRHDYHHQSQHSSSYYRNRSYSKDKYNSDEEKGDRRKPQTKNFHFLLALPKHYMRVVEDSYDYLFKQVLFP